MIQIRKNQYYVIRFTVNISYDSHQYNVIRYKDEG